MTTTLIVLAATMGNRYGGLKVLDGIGSNGETILDYSIYDALQVGFNRIVFVISKSFEGEFKAYVSDKYKNVIDIEFVYQEVELVDERNPKRTMLWGSAHGVLTAQPVIDGPFGVINAVNFYQRESFELLYNHIHNNDGYPYFMVGYHLKNVLSESGSVKRGLCKVNDKDELLSIATVDVERVSGNPMCLNELGKWVELNENTFVSMNMWGFPANIFDSLKDSFSNFVHEKGMELDSHFSIPDFINERINNGLRVKVVETPGKWMGLVSADDRSQVILRIHEMIRKKVYPAKLFNS